MNWATSVLIVLGAILAVVLVVSVVVDSPEAGLERDCDRPADRNESSDLQNSKKYSPSREYVPQAAPQECKQVDVRTFDEESDSKLTPAEQKTVDAIQDALDGDDYAKIREQLKDASASTNPAVRAKAVEALQWFGEKALLDLVPFLADSDDDVKGQTETAVEQGLLQMEDERAKVQYIESIMSIKGACSTDSLNMLSGQLNGISDETLTVSAALRIIVANKNPEAVQAMKEVYEFATGDAYTTADAAKKWIDAKVAADIE